MGKNQKNFNIGDLTIKFKMFKDIVEDNFFEKNDLKELQSIVENKSELEEKLAETKSIVD